MSSLTVNNAAEPMPPAAHDSQPLPSADVSKPANYAKSRLNAVRHGLTAREFVCTPEEAPKYAEHLAALKLHYQPEGLPELDLVARIANAMWRLDRATSIEEGIFALALATESVPADPLDSALAPARAWLASSRQLALLTTYEARIRRALAADKLELSNLQEKRAQKPVNQPAAAVPESVCSTAPDQTKQPAPPPESVCSTPAVTPKIALSKPPQYVLVVESPRKPGHRDAA